jgi:RNA polymerase sigma factor (sigma-70 family)
MDDWDLLREYSANGSQAAFEELVARHIDLVYAAALRQVGDRHLAEDVTQGVFLVLSQKAAALARQSPGVLAGWLFNVARFTSANALKTEKRRRKHECDSLKLMKDQDDSDEADWERLAPYLDTALSKLSATDRDALLLRFFSGKSHRAISQTLGVSEEAARKRVLRAVERLRAILRKRGVPVAASGLTAILMSQTSQAAPAGLPAACAARSCGSAGTALAKGAIVMMAATKAKVAVIAALAIIVMAGAGGLLIEKVIEMRKPTAANARIMPIQTPQPASFLPATPNGKISGIVNMAGEALPKAEVLLATLAKPVDVYSSLPSGVAQTITADDGSFQFDPPDGPFQVVVRHRLGYAHVTREQLEKTNRIDLQPWARIEGIANIGSKPAGAETIILFRGNDNPRDPYTMLLNLGQTTVADAQGHYAFDRVVPGYTRVYRRLPLPWRFITAEQDVEAIAGKTLNVPLGGRGRPVIGRVALPAGLQEKIDWNFGRQNPTAPRASGFNAFIGPAGIPFKFNGVVDLKLDEPSPDELKLTWEELRIKREAWRNSPAGRKLLYGMGITESNFDIHPDGSFRIDDVPPGKHQLLVSIYHSNLGPGERVAEINLPVEIGDLSAQGGQSDEPLNLGTIVLKRTPGLRIGQPAPALALKKLDGQSVKLADFAGKFILLILWNDTKRPTEADLRAIKLANDHDGKSGKLVVLTIEYENDPQAARRLIEECGMAGIGIHCLGQKPPDSSTESSPTNILPSDYFQTPSLITLVDPEGKISATNLSGKEIDGAIYRAIFARN